MEKKSFNTTLWTRIAIINLFIVALAGIALRYKINFSLPAVNHKYLLHAHSHFAFAGWAALALMALMTHYLQRQGRSAIDYRKYHWILAVNCISAYGMLIAFFFQGYAFFSISFSTLSIFVSYFFAYYYWRDLNKLRDGSHARPWLRTSLVLWVFSSIGAFTLAYLMANRITSQDYYFGAIYFFLHFQYNGWFLFACFGLLFSLLFQQEGAVAGVPLKRLFLVMMLTVWPTYFLSILWLKLPDAIYWIANISGILQLAAVFYFVRLLFYLKKENRFRLSGITRYLWGLASVAFVIKIILQALSIIPSLSKYAFGYRAVVVGYLHLSFLGIISFFILGYINQSLSGKKNFLPAGGVMLFVAGVILQELILMFQGLEAIEFKVLPHANIILFYTTILIGAGLAWIALKMSGAKQEEQGGAVIPD